MKKLTICLAVCAMAVLSACGDKKTEPNADVTTPAATTPAPEPVDSVALEIEAATKELEQNSENLKKALNDLQ